MVADMGANDACDSPTLSAALFGSQLEDGLRAIAARAPAARIVVVSIIDELALWDAVKTVPEARTFRTLCTRATKRSSSLTESDRRPEPRAGDRLRPTSEVPLRRRRGLPNPVVKG